MTELPLSSTTIQHDRLNSLLNMSDTPQSRREPVSQSITGESVLADTTTRSVIADMRYSNA